MPTKYRYITATALVTGPNNYRFSTSTQQTSEYITDSNAPARWKACRHIRAYPANVQSISGSYLYTEYCCSLAPAEWALNHAKANIASFVGSPSLEFQKNNDFRIFIFLAQIDDLFASFSLKFAKSLLGFDGPFKAYASTKWGLMPLLSDFEALLATYTDLRGKIVEELRNVKRSKPFRALLPVQGFDVTNQRSYKGSITLDGTLSVTNIPDEITLPIILDEFGMNFRFTDLLDLVPFSFLLSHVVPNITAFLDSQHPNKWFNPNFTYSGWAQTSVVADGKLEYSMQQRRVPLSAYGYERFQTTFRPGKKPELKWKYPDVRLLNDAGALIGMRTFR